MSDDFYTLPGVTAVAQDAPEAVPAPEVAPEPEAAPAALEIPSAALSPSAETYSPAQSVPDEADEGEKPYGYVRHKHQGVQAGPADHPRTQSHGKA
jgi:hypothetical protein